MTEAYIDESQIGLTWEEDWEERKDRIRYERRRKRRMERLRREKRQRMLVRSLFFGLLGLILVLRFVTVRSGREAEGEAVMPREQAIADAGQPERSEIAKITEQILEEAQRTTAEGLQNGKTQTEKTQIEEAQTQETETEEEIRVYQFAETEDTVFIDSADVISSHAILVDENTDKIIASKGARERIIPASMTKVLTILVAAENIPEEKLDDTFTMTLEITDYAYVNDCSSVGFLDEEKVPVRDLFYGTAMQSGGDAALALAYYTAGS